MGPCIKYPRINLSIKLSNWTFADLSDYNLVCRSDSLSYVQYAYVAIFRGGWCDYTYFVGKAWYLNVFT